MKVWWCNQTQSWEIDRRHGVLFASDREAKLTNQETVGDVVLGHLIVHYRKPNVVAISRASENARRYGYMTGAYAADYRSGWLVATEYFDLAQPLHHDLFSAALLKYLEPHGPINRRGAIRTGYLFPFAVGGLSVLLSHVEEALPKWLAELKPVKSA